MADVNLLSKIKLDGVTYNLKDAKAREDIATILEKLKTYQPLITDDAKLAATLVSTSVEGLTSSNVNAALGELLETIDAGRTGSVVTVEKAETAEAGYIATYEIKQGGKKVGVSINIPKDYLVKSGELKTVTEAGVPYTGAKVGDKYIDFVVNSKDDLGEESHIYLPVNDLVDVYKADDSTLQLDTSTNTFSVKAVPMSSVTGLETELTKLTGFAYAASITVPSQTITGVKATGDINVSVADGAITYTSTSVNAGLTTKAYTPAGSVAVTLSDETTATGVATLSYGSYTPAGTVAAPTVTVAPTSKSFASEGIVAAIDSTDAECLVISAAGTANALTAVSATASAPKFTGTAENIKATGATFKKQVAAATFTGVEEANAIVTGATVAYDKASLDGSKITAATTGLTVGNIEVTAKTVNAPEK